MGVPLRAMQQVIDVIVCICSAVLQSKCGMSTSGKPAYGAHLCCR
jgi:hypothetical protein